MILYGYCSNVQTKNIEALNDIYGKLKKNQITGRMVLKMDH